MLPLAPGANGQPPSPPTEASSRVTPAVHGRVGAGQAGAAGVVEVRAERDVADQRAHPRDQVADAPRGGRADGVGDRQPVDAGLAGRVDDVDHPLRRRRAVERAVPCRGDDDLHRGAAVVRDARRSPRSVRSPPRWSARRSTRLWPSAADTTYSIECRPAAIARLAPFGLATSAENSMPSRVPVLMQFGGEFGGVGQRGHLRRRDEGRRLHLPHAGGGDGCEQFELGGQRNRLFDLQPVAQRDVANVDMCG